MVPFSCRGSLSASPKYLSASQARILEIGCATGEYLATLHNHGYQNLVGIEYNPDIAQMARERHGLEVIEGDIFAGAFPSQTFDVVIMRYVLEHVPNPMSTLREVHRLLKPGGWYIFSIPNPDSLDARVYGKYWFGHEIPRHLHNYPQETLKHMLAQTGLDLHKLEFPYIPNDWILGFKNLLIGHNAPRWLSNLLDIRNPLALFMFLPLGLISGLTRSSGRMRVKAQKIGIGAGIP